MPILCTSELFKNKSDDIWEDCTRKFNTAFRLLNGRHAVGHAVERLRLAKVVKPTYRLHIGARVNAALLTSLLTSDSMLPVTACRRASDGMLPVTACRRASDGMLPVTACPTASCRVRHARRHAAGYGMPSGIRRHAAGYGMPDGKLPGTACPTACCRVRACPTACWMIESQFF